MDSILIETGIGLAIVFAVVATIATALNQAVTRLLNTRSKMLWASIAALLEPNADQRPEIGFSFIWRALPGLDDERPTADNAAANTPSRASRAADLHNTASIRGLDYVRPDDKRSKVWWIDPKVFASAVHELASLQSAGTLRQDVDALATQWTGTPFGDYLGRVAVNATSSTEEFLNAVGDWFDGQMKTLSQTYARNVKWVLGVLGLVAAFSFNVDAIRVAEALYDDAQTREAAVAFADDLDICESADGEGSTDDECDFKAEIAQSVAALDQLDELGIPVSGDWKSPIDEDVWGDGPADALWHIVGLLLTGVLAAFGGPFWWDFVRFLTGLRRTK